MTAMPRELARKQPANLPTRAQDDGRTINGQYRAVRGGPSGRAVLNVFLLALLAAFFAGQLLSMF